MQYQLLLCDLDDTLLDFHAAEKMALQQALKKNGIRMDEGIYSLYKRINESWWKTFERGHTTLETLKIARFRELLGLINAQADPGMIALTYMDALSFCAPLMPYALSFVQSVSSRIPIYLITNGIASVQKSRLEVSGLLPYITDSMVSEEVGAPKPDPRMINMTLNKYFANKKDAVMLGDSLSADIAAAQNAGIDSIWLHRPTHTEISSPATYNVNCLEEAESILLQ